MITKLLPHRIKDWIRERVAPLPVDLMKYFPYQGNAAAFFIPKVPARPHEVCAQGLPVPPSSFFINYKTSDEYLVCGQRDTGAMLDVLAGAGRPLQAGARVLDFGCSGGRMIRWLKPYAADCEIWGTDISAGHIVWCKQNLMPHFNFLVSTTLPHLPFEDRYFDLIYSGSVFTHIEDLADAWLLELRRILKPGGLLYVTIHDENTVRLLEKEQHALSNNMLSNEQYREYTQADYGMFAVYRGPNSQVFYRLDYFCRMVSHVYNVVSVTPEAYGYQTAVLLERKQMNSQTGKISGIFTGAQRGADKLATDSAELIAGHGIKGDSHAGLKPHRQISLFESEVLWAVNGEGISLSAGELSVNLLTENIRLDALAPGSLLRVGAAIIEITEARKPCGSLTKIDRRLPKRLYRNLGVFGRIIEGGSIRTGATIEVLTAAHPQTTL